MGDKSTRLNLKNAHVANTTGKSFVQSESGEIESISIDSFVDQYNLKKIDIIKMDIEGMEKEAIAGARHSIQKYHPTLLLSAYHKPNDFFIFLSKSKIYVKTTTSTLITKHLGHMSLCVMLFTKIRIVLYEDTHY